MSRGGQSRYNETWERGNLNIGLISSKLNIMMDTKYQDHALNTVFLTKLSAGNIKVNACCNLTELQRSTLSTAAQFNVKLSDLSRFTSSKWGNSNSYWSLILYTTDSNNLEQNRTYSPKLSFCVLSLKTHFKPI